jgi:hypothetical protein
MMNSGAASKVAGAGAILYSKLCYRGYHLPGLILCDSDEKHLVDIEVRSLQQNVYLLLLSTALL